jgi:FkbM family methyltransferase
VPPGWQTTLRMPGRVRGGHFPVLKRALDRVRSLAARLLVDVDDHATVMDLGRAHGLRDIVVDGEYGLIQGSIEDRSVLLRYWKTKTWRPTLIGFLSQSLSDHGEGTYLDIGANIGLTTIPIARPGRVTCFAFEPEPENFRYLCNNVRQNCPGATVHPYNVALFDKAGTMEFQLSKRHKGDHHLRVEGAGSTDTHLDEPTIKVETVLLDDVLLPRLPTLPAPLVVKIVAQGAEPYIIAGGERTLAQAHAMAIELYPYGLKQLGGDPGALTRFCAEQFGMGAFVEGDHEGAFAWRPVSLLIDDIAKCYVEAAATPSAYFHLFLKKTDALSRN